MCYSVAMNILLAFLVALLIGGVVVALAPRYSKPFDPDNYKQGYSYGKKTGNSYFAPFEPNVPFNAGAAQAVQDTKK